MNAIIRHSIVCAAGALLFLAAGSARADAAEVMTVKVPFAFTVHNKTLPAGQYIVEQDDLNPVVLLIRNVNEQHDATYVVTNTASSHDPAGDQPCLSFAHVDHHYQLSSIWESAIDGHSIIDHE